AYIRWQLTGLVTGWPALDRRAVWHALQNAPRMLVNPRAEEQVMAFFGNAADAGPIRADRLDLLRAASKGLDERTALYEAFNGPALAWRDWLRKRLEPETPQVILSLIEQC